jgi:hypothetical protein
MLRQAALFISPHLLLEDACQRVTCTQLCLTRTSCKSSSRSACKTSHTNIVSFVAGTSTGAIIVAAVVAGIPAPRILNFYLNRVLTVSARFLPGFPS